MPISRHHTGRWLYQFDRVIPGAGRQRANRVLPEGWTKPQAQAYDRAESARLYALAAGISQPAEPLIDDAVLLYLTQHAPGLKNFRDLQGALALMLPAYTGQPMSQLATVARTYATAQAGKISAATIHNRLAYLRAACRWAWKAHNMGEHDPAERMQLPKINNARHEYYDRATMLRIARAMPHPASRAAYRVGFYTGLRISEVLASQPVQANNQAALKITDSKNGRPHIVPLHPHIAHLVATLAQRKQWPLNITKWTVSKHFKAAARSLGLSHLRLHDSRHSAASEMINADVDLYTVGAVLNHKSATSTRRYAHLATARLREAVNKIGQRKGGL